MEGCRIFITKSDKISKSKCNIIISHFALFFLYFVLTIFFIRLLIHDFINESIVRSLYQ